MATTRNLLLLCIGLGGLLASLASADGMRPETTVVILYEQDGEATLNVSNTDATPALLHAVVENLPEDPQPLLLVTPPVSRVDAGETQLVRFISTQQEPLKVQRLRRVSFEGIPPARAPGGATVGISLRQNIPLILHPRDLPRHRSPWELLKWQVRDGELRVHNDSAYVVRMALELVLKPGAVSGRLPRSYILPGEQLVAQVDGALEGVSAVQFQPASVYGFTVQQHEAAILTDRR